MDIVSGSPVIPGDDVPEDRHDLIADEWFVVRVEQILVGCYEEPERGVGRIVLRFSPHIRKTVRENTLIDGSGETA